MTLVGGVADERDAARVRDEASRHVPSALDAVVASLGRWVSAPSLLAATRAELVDVLEKYVVAHFVVARTFLPALPVHGGSYTLINGPSAFAAWPGSGLVSVATAGQAMLARALAEEAGVRDSVRITDLVIHPSAWIGPETTAGGGPIDGAAVGRYVAGLRASQVTGGTTVHLESPEQLGDETALDAVAATSYLPALLLTITFRLWSGHVLWRDRGEPAAYRRIDATTSAA